MRIEKRDNNKEETKEKGPKGKVIEVSESVRIPGTKIILEQGDKIEVFSEEKKEEDSLEEKKNLDEASKVNFNVSFSGVTGSFTVTKGMDYVYNEDSEEPQEVEKIMLNGSFDVNLECGSMPEVTAIENAVQSFVNSFAKEKEE